MKKHFLNMMSRPLAWMSLFILFCNAVRAAAPDWRNQIVSYPNYTGVLARVKLNGATVSSEGSLLAAFHGDETTPRGVAEVLGSNPDDDIDGESYFSLLFGSEEAGEKGFTFKLWNSADDRIYDLDKTLDFDTNYPAKPAIYGGFTSAGFVPCVMNVASGKYRVTVAGGTADKTEAEPGEVVTITATLPTNQGLKKWTASNDVDFVGSALGATTTIVMPAYDVTVAASFIAKSDMPAVSVRSTTNTGDDTATEPSSSTGTAADKGKFTFTRTNVNVAKALTVHYSIRGTAVNGVDYKSIASSVTFAANSTSVAVDIEPLFDGTAEGDETVEVVLEPESGTQTYRGGTYTDATVTIKDSQPVVDPTVKYTLSPAAAVAAGARWKIDSGAWNTSGAMVTTTVGTHTIYFKDVTGYTTPASQTITLKSGDKKTGTAAYAVSDGKYTLTVSGGKINGTATTGKFAAGEEVTITATLPSNQGLKIWTPSKDVEFVGSRLAATTTIKMPAYDVTVAASFVNKSDMQAVAVRSTTNSGDDTSTEPSTSTASATDKGKFTFTRTSSSGALTVYFSIRGTATNGTDYKQITSSVTFANGSTSVTREIEPLYDGVTEGDETVEVVLVPQASTQTYRGGAVTEATVTIKDSQPVVNPTVKYTLSPAAAVTAGARWKIDTNGAWNASGATVTTTVGTHTIYFKDVTGYTTPDSQSITLKSGDNKTGTAAYAVSDGKYTLTVTGGKINGTSSTGKFSAGEEVTITATLPTNQGLKKWTANKDVEFIGSVLGATTTIKMPAYDVTVTASFVNKSDMQAVAVRSTTNTGDDTATEPSSSTASATDKGKFTFTRTSSSGALTVYFSIRGTATNGTDYKQITSSITFASGSTSVTREIEPLYDGVTEGDETVTVVLVPQASTQTYRGGAVTEATVTIKDSQPVVNPTVKYTLSPSAAVTAGARWKIDSGAWNTSGATVTTTVGTHTIYFKDVTGYTTPASQSVTLTSGQAKTGTAAYTAFDGKYTLTVSGGKINGTSTTGKFSPGEEVTITATLPSSQGLKVWTPSKDVEFIGSRLAATTTIKMPAYDVTVAASFVVKSSMPAVSVRSTTNTGDDTAKEPSSSTATATNKGTFTFTRTTVNQSKALTVHYSVRGTATNGVDYRTIQSSVTFAANATSVSVEIEPLFDGTTEGDETVEVVLEPESGTQTYRGGAVTEAMVTIQNTDPINELYHPADCMTKDFVISGLEYLQYAGPVKTAALGNYEYDWNGTDVLSLVRKTTRGGEAPQTRGGDIAITRTVSPAVYSANSTVAVTLTFGGTDKMSNLFIGEMIPNGWTVVGAAADYVVDGVLRMAWDAPEIPASYTYTIKAPSVNLADSYVITSSAGDTGCFADGLMPVTVTDTALLNSNNHYVYHPADCLNKDGRISGLEFLRYAGPVRALALANEEYTWDGSDVLSIRPKNATRGGAAADVAIARSVNTTTYEANSQIIVTLSIGGAGGIVSLFVGERLPEGWTVVGDYADNVKNGVLRMAWDAPNIPDTITYTLQAPAENLSAVCKIASSTADTGCFTDRVLLLDAGETILTHGSMEKPAEWPQDLTFYAPADGRNFREADNLPVTFSWPAIHNAEGYRLIVAAYDGTVVFDETLEETSCAVRGLEQGSFVWNVTAIGDGCIAGTIWQDFRFAVVPPAPVPIIVGAIADGTTVRLAFDKAEPGYTDSEITYQVIFYSLENQTLTNLTPTVTVADGKAVIDLGVAAANGYLAIRPVTTPESDFTELYVK